MVVVKIIGLDRKGFRVKDIDGHYRTVTSTTAANVDITDGSVQRVLKRNSYRFVSLASDEGPSAPSESVSPSASSSPSSSVSVSTSLSKSPSASKSPSSSSSLSVSPSASASPSS